ncbi:uncharacterized protein LOC125680172 [Ostrea edulis]|uniref:uncharacterized protein LOC125680172 n=1 Tax=Ostrea edulis TaxID=37623 RepID=UPI0024AEA6CD|nr:uncharacterized protein LOC125680172 [Ostrea edulis]
MAPRNKGKQLCKRKLPRQGGFPQGNSHDRKTKTGVQRYSSRRSFVRPNSTDHDLVTKPSLDSQSYQTPNCDELGETSTCKLRTSLMDHPGSNTTHVYEVSKNVPRIPQFSGDDPPQKGDVSYKEWRYEVQCLLGDPDIKESLLIQSIRRSLRGTAKTMLIPLGERANVQKILSKLDILFGEISTNGMIMQEFFSTCQLPGECVTSFGCSLETMLQNAIDSGYMDQASKNDLLRHQFWTSLSSEKLKWQTSHKYDSIKNYDKLLLEIRRVEKEISISSRTEKKPVHQHWMSAGDGDMETKLSKRMDELEQKLEGKIEDKFNKILERLEGNMSGNQRFSENGQGRGGYSKSKGSIYEFRGICPCIDSTRHRVQQKLPCNYRYQCT